MNQDEANRFNELYKTHQRLLKLQGKSQKTIDAYSRAVRRVSEHFNCCPDQLTQEQFEIYFLEKLIGATRKLRYRVFLLTTYSMGLRLEEALALPPIFLNEG